MRFASVALLAFLVPACNKSTTNDDPDAGSVGGANTNGGGAASGNGGDAAGGTRGGTGGANAGASNGGEDGTDSDASSAGGGENGADAGADDPDAGDVGGSGGDGAGGSGGDGAGGNGSVTGIPGPGLAQISATFSDPVDGYDGSVEDYVSVESQGTANVDTTIADDAYGFETSNGATSGLLRNVNVRVIGIPTTGATFDIGTGSDAFIEGNLMEYAETNLSTFTPKISICAGTVTFDTVAGSSYLFHFTGECIPYSGATGGITITGTGVGTLTHS